MADPTEFTVYFVKAEPKKWSTRYNECDEDGEDISDNWPETKIGSIYIKHATNVGKMAPDFIEVTVKGLKELP